MAQVTEKQVEAGVKKAREMLDAYSSFYSGMVSDDQLKALCHANQLDQPPFH